MLKRRDGVVVVVEPRGKATSYCYRQAQEDAIFLFKVIQDYPKPKREKGTQTFEF